MQREEGREWCLPSLVPGQAAVRERAEVRVLEKGVLQEHQQQG